MTRAKNAGGKTTGPAAATAAGNAAGLRSATRRTRRRARRDRCDADALDSDAAPADIDAFRLALARRISRFIGDRRRAWRTCKEPACRRHRCCRAPHIHCSNAPPPRHDPDGRRAARAVAQVQRMLRDLPAQQGEKP